MVGNKNIKEIKEKIKNFEIKELKDLDIKYLVEQEILDCFLRINASEDQIKKLIDCHNDIFDRVKIDYAEIIKPDWRNTDELLVTNPRITSKPSHLPWRNNNEPKEMIIENYFPFEFLYCYIFEDAFKNNIIKNLEDYINETIKDYLDIRPTNRNLVFLRKKREKSFCLSINNKKFKDAKKIIIERYEAQERWSSIPYYALSKELKSDELIIKWAMYVDEDNLLYLPKEVKEDQKLMNKLRKEGYSV